MSHGGCVVPGRAGVVAGVEGRQVGDGQDARVLVQGSNLGPGDALGRYTVLGPGDLEGRVAAVDGALDRHPLPQGQVPTQGERTQLGRHCGDGTLT